MEKYVEHLENTFEPLYQVNEDDAIKGFNQHAVSWDCKEAETDGQNSPMIGDEIEVGTLWEDKSQKDFKSYL